MLKVDIKCALRADDRKDLNHKKTFLLKIITGTTGFKASYIYKYKSDCQTSRNKKKRIQNMGYKVDAEKMDSPSLIAAAKNNLSIIIVLDNSYDNLVSSKAKKITE